MGLFSSKRRELTPAEEAARRRMIHIPDDDAANLAQERARVRVGTGVRVTSAPQDAGAIETKTVTLRMRERVGLTGKNPAADAKKLEKLIAEGWEIVSQTQAPHGARMTTYVLRRAR